MEDSILATVKQMLGIEVDDTAFDTDIVIFINNVFAQVCQIGIGPQTPTLVTGYDTTWSEFTTEPMLESIKTYIYLKVKLLFDPPQSSAVSEAYQKQCDEIQWRMYVTCGNY